MRPTDAAASLKPFADEPSRCSPRPPSARARVFASSASERPFTGGNIFGAADRIRYLTPHLHEEMVSELRSPGIRTRTPVSTYAPSSWTPAPRHS